jgi:hypothetical protein
MPARLDHEPTEAQLDDARDLIDETKAETDQYVDVEVAKAAGYESIGDARTGFEHFVHPERLADDTILDPAAPESLVYRVHADGTREFTTVMYILPPDSTMDDVPDVAGNLTMWHGHDNLCFDEGSVRISGFVRNGACFPKGEPGTPPMLHVWVTPNDCGPFAGTDAGQMSGSCVDDFEL